ncbi:MAG: acyl-CoA dehydrogenase family protein [Candidatus Obscuribacterales bacterium]|nr:acyl-CoA dehydrogenase family protein [Steroidobacteraceae bacterium]
MTEVQTFRSETRAWLEANCPPSMRTPMGEDDRPWGGKKTEPSHPDVKVWLDRMAARGWTVPTWPQEYGGGGLTTEEAKVLAEEMDRINARLPLVSFGIWMFGPVLMEFGNEAQKRKFLPQIARGEIRWCQGYSEPGAGSDLAGLQTRCEDKGDHYLINGQKVWTSYADKSDWIFCLVRTDTTKKQGGISFIVFDMTTPGVEARPIKLISGSSPFCETFFTDVKVPKEDLIGQVNGGWEIAKRLLQYERKNISAGGFGGGTEVQDFARRYIGLKEGILADADFRTRLAIHKMEAHAFELTVKRSAAEARSGKDVGATTSIVKYAVAKMNQERRELGIEAMGMAGLGWEGPGFEEDALAETRQWLRAKGNSIEGGTSEINLNVLSKRVLNLPE